MKVCSCVVSSLALVIGVCAFIISIPYISNYAKVKYELKNTQHLNCYIVSLEYAAGYFCVESILDLKLCNKTIFHVTAFDPVTNNNISGVIETNFWKNDPYVVYKAGTSWKCFVHTIKDGFDNRIIDYGYWNLDKYGLKRMMIGMIVCVLLFVISVSTIIGITVYENRLTRADGDEIGSRGYARL